jgi:hypothetical protein
MRRMDKHRHWARFKKRLDAGDRIEVPEERNG